MAADWMRTVGARLVFGAALKSRLAACGVWSSLGESRTVAGSLS